MVKEFRGPRSDLLNHSIGLEFEPAPRKFESEFESLFLDSNSNFGF
jgi:hypothetical protein